MNASIIAVITACSAAVGASFSAPRTGSVTRCPLPGHKDSTASFSVKETWNSFKCFGCGAHGGIVDAPVAFGLAQDRTEASRWLSERGLIPPAIGTGEKSTLQMAPRKYINTSELPPDLVSFRTASHLDLIDEIGYARYRAVRDVIAVERAVQTTKSDKLLREFLCLLAVGYIVQRDGLGPWINTQDAYERAAASFPTLTELRSVA